MSDVVSVEFGREDIRRRIEELGRTITGDYEGRAPVLISVLKGGSVFLADLMREIALPIAIDYMSISRYGGAAESLGRVRIVKDLDHDIGGRDVIVVEDIVDTGLTLSYLISVLDSREPASVEVCALLDKSVRRIVPLELRYRGFDCPDEFVVGYGLDFEERFRNVPDILAARPRAAWFQLGIRHDEAAEALARAGILVVQDRCLLVEHRRLKRKRTLDFKTTSYSPLLCSSSPWIRSRFTMIERWMRMNWSSPSSRSSSESVRRMMCVSPPTWRQA